MSISTIYNFKFLTEKIATSGQPTEEELIFISNAGYKVVVNLGLSNTDYSVNNEAAFFEGKNIIYIHIPVAFEDPLVRNLTKFIKVLNKYKDSYIFIHCAANKRVSVFMALYRILSLGWSVDLAMKDLNTVWRPNEIWQSFIDDQLSSLTEPR